MLQQLLRPYRKSKVIRSLPEVLAYQNDELVYRFSEDFQVSLADAEDIFTETKRWLWLCGYQLSESANGRAPVFLPLLSEVHSIDLMWHTFLLFSKDYSEFCELNFGAFIHHSPQTRAERDSWLAKVEANAEAAKAERRASLRNVYEFIHDLLGGDVLVRWIEEFPERFARLGE